MDFSTLLRLAKRGAMVSAGAAIAALLLAGCGGGSGSSPISGKSGTAQFSLTDAPSCGQFTSVVVNIIGVQVVGSNGTPYTLTLNNPLQQNLLNLTNGVTANLGPIPIPAGTYNQIRLILAGTTSSDPNPANYVTTKAGGTTKYPLTTPSAQQSGYKVVGNFTIGAGQTADVTMDFNACQSVVTAGNSGKYLLKPVIKATDSSSSGAITGIASAGASVFAEDSAGHLIKSTIAASNGNFTLSPVPASSAGYNVVVASPQPASGSSAPSPNIAPDVVLNVPVTAGSNTAVSTSSLPAVASSSTVTYSGTVTLANADADVLVLAQQPVTSPSTAATSTITFANILASPTSSTTGNTSSTYSLTFSQTPPQVADWNASRLNFTSASTAPTITVSGFGSDGSTGVANSTSPNDITMSGSGDTTFQSDN